MKILFDPGSMAFIDLDEKFEKRHAFFALDQHYSISTHLIGPAQAPHRSENAKSPGLVFLDSSQIHVGDISADKPTCDPVHQLAVARPRWHKTC